MTAKSKPPLTEDQRLAMIEALKPMLASMFSAADGMTCACRKLPSGESRQTMTAWWLNENGTYRSKNIFSTRDQAVFLESLLYWRDLEKARDAERKTAKPVVIQEWRHPNRFGRTSSKRKCNHCDEEYFPSAKLRTGSCGLCYGDKARQKELALARGYRPYSSTLGRSKFDSARERERMDLLNKYWESVKVADYYTTLSHRSRTTALGELCE